MSGKRLFLFTFIVLFATAESAAAFNLADIVQFHGFGGWSYGDTDGNKYLSGNEDGEYDNFQFALAVAANPVENLRINAQSSWEENVDESEVALDYAFAEWFFNDALMIRIGKVKQPLGIYNEVYDVGTVRPFFYLPQAVYGDSGFVCKSYKGVGITGSYFNCSGWGFEYDVYGGKMDVEAFFPFVLYTILPAYEQAKAGLAQASAGKTQAQTAVADASTALEQAQAAGDASAIAAAEAAYNQASAALGEATQAEAMVQTQLDQIKSYPPAYTIPLEEKDVFGGRITFQTPFNLSIGASAYQSAFDKAGGEEGEQVSEIFGEFEDKDLYLVAGHVQYIYRFITLRGEYLHGEIDEWVDADAAYAELSLRFLDHWQAAFRYEWLDYEFTLPGIDTEPIPSLLEHEEWAVGLNYWFSSNFVIKASYHQAEGNRFALADNLQNIIDDGVEEKTELYLIGAQFSF